MNVSEWVKKIDPNTLVSEQDVRTKIAVPLIKLLGYDESHYADEFPIYSYSGKKGIRLNMLIFYALIQMDGNRNVTYPLGSGFRIIL